jgi:hypothetical protein
VTLNDVLGSVKKTNAQTLVRTDVHVFGPKSSEAFYADTLIFLHTRCQHDVTYILNTVPWQNHGAILLVEWCRYISLP